MVVHFPGDNIMDHMWRRKKLIFDGEKMDHIGTLIYSKCRILKYATAERENEEAHKVQQEQ